MVADKLVLKCPLFNALLNRSSLIFLVSFRGPLPHILSNAAKIKNSWRIRCIRPLSGAFDPGRRVGVRIRPICRGLGEKTSILPHRVLALLLNWRTRPSRFYAPPPLLLYQLHRCAGNE